jgi:DNA primase
MATKLPDLVNLMEAQGLALKKSGRGYIALCPFHDDHNPSLSVYTGRTGTWQFKCCAGTETGQRGGLRRLHAIRRWLETR